MGIIVKAIKAANEFPALDTRGWHEVSSMTSAYDHYKGNDYENAYPSITKIVNRFMKIKPYGIDEKKETVQNARAVEKLYKPNRQMSSVDFREALAVMYLVHPRTHILVWRLDGSEARPGGDLTAENIAGYTFLENAVESTIGGKTTYTVNGASYSDAEVITLKGMFPHNLARGYSPTEAAQRWSRIDDYIADYQQGFFKNGAIPSGQFIITAPTAKEYKDIVEMMQLRHRGAGKNNNVTYSHRPIDPNSGKPADAQVEWKPFNVDNKNLDLKNIFEQVNQKLDSAFGVPASIRGVGQNNNFATAQQDNLNFVENVIDPLALKIWTRFTHELNRITGGLGYAITYDLKLPSVSQDEKVRAETRKLDGDTVSSLVENGFTLESAKAYVKTGDIDKLEVAIVTVAEEVKDDMDVDTGDEVEDSPDQPKDGDIVPKAVQADPKVKKLTPEQEATTEQQLYTVSKRFLESQVNSAMQDIKAFGDPTEEEVRIFVNDALDIISKLLVSQGAIEQALGVQMLQNAGIDPSTVSNFKLSTNQVERYRKYLFNVGKSYASDTATAIRTVLDRANINGTPAQQIKNELRNLVKLDDYRAVRLARTETVRAGGNASLLSMEQIQAETGVEVRKVWNVNASDPCPYCQALDGTAVGLNTPFVPTGGIIEGTDGSIMVNNFVPMEIASGHPNCRCSLVYEVVK
jgi:phage portal protein BeeE